MENLAIKLGFKVTLNRNLTILPFIFYIYHVARSSLCGSKLYYVYYDRNIKCKMLFKIANYMLMHDILLDYK